MKKLLLLTLVLLGGVMQVSAVDDIVVYFSPNYGWTLGTDVNFRLNQTNDEETSWKQVTFQKFSNDVDHVYCATFSASEGFTKFKIQKYDGDTYKNQFINYVTGLDHSVYYIMYNGDYGNEDYYPYYTSTYLPCNYYLASTVTGDWKVDTKMNETSSGVFEVTKDRDTYKDKYLTWAPGYSFLADGTISSIAEYRMVNGWDHILRPTNETSADVTINFEKYSYNETLKTGGGSVWKLSSSDEGDFTVSYIPSTKSATISSTKTATISPVGYSTYSNGEMCTISGATAYTVSANNTSSVTMNKMGAATIWPARAGMILKGESGATVTISAVASDATATTIGTNYLVGTGNSSAEITATENTYVFANDATYGVGFYLATESGTLAAHKAYLDLSGASGKAGEFLSFNFDEEETDGISKVANASFDANAQVYNLAGQKVGANYKGIVIVNGKKVVRK